MTVKLQIVPKPVVQLKGVLGFPGRDGAPGAPTTPNSITNNYLADMPLNTIKGRASVGLGDPEDLTSDQVKEMLSITTSDVSGLGELASLNFVGAGNYESGSVDNGALSSMAQARIKGRANTAGTGAPQDLTAAQVKAILALASADISDFTTTVDARIKTGSVINSAYAEYTANADLTVAIPTDDTIPQNTEGTQILSVSLTPSSTTNKVRVRATIVGTHASAGIAITAALFVNSGSGAVRVSTQYTPAANYLVCVHLEYEHTPGSTSAQTYAIRAGGTSGTIRLNGNTASRLFGGASASTLTVEEIKA